VKYLEIDQQLRQQDDVVSAEKIIRVTYV